MNIHQTRGKFSVQDRGVLTLSFDTLEQAIIFRTHYEVAKEMITAATIRYFRTLSNRKQKALERAGILEPARVTPNVPTIDWICNHASSELDYLKDNTLKNHRQAQRHLRDHFGCDKRLSDITVSDAVKWMKKLLRTKADSTVLTLTSIARQYWHLASEVGIPLADVWGKAKKKLKLSKVSKGREHFVTKLEMKKLLSKCESREMRNILVLGRYMGLRVPSEIRGVKWSDFNWESGVFTVRDQKRGRIRKCPIFPEVREHFLREYGGTPCSGSPPCQTNSISYQITEAMKKAGVSWKKPFINMRSSRATELERAFSIQAASAWLGHGVDVARSHYLQVTDDVWKQAIGAKGNDHA